MPTYKLTYFDARSHAEPIRMIFALAGVQYEDIRLCDDEWDDLKASGKTPFGQLPILEVDGKVIAQSLSIIAYVAREHGLAPSNSMEEARASMVSHTLHEVGEKILKFALEWDDDKKETMKEDFYENYLPQQLSNLEKLLKSNTNGKGFFAGDTVSYADIHFFSLFNGFLAEGKIESPEDFAGYPALLELYNRIMNVPKIKDWMKTRPESDI